MRFSLSLKAAIVSAIMLSASLASATINIAWIDFYKSSNAGYNESVTADTGGTVQILVTNVGATNETIDQVQINGVDPTALANYKWHRVYPATLAPGDASVVTVKCSGAPLASGQAINVYLHCASGQTASATGWGLSTPALRIGYINMSSDMRYMYIFMRNLDTTAAYTPNGVLINNGDYSASTTYMNCSNLGINGTAILKVDMGSAQPLLKTFAIRVRSAKSTGGDQWIGADYRAFAGKFQLGTWDSGMNNSAAGMNYFRNNMKGNIVTGSTDESLNSAMYANYGLQAFPQPRDGSGNVDTAYVQRNATNPAIYCWNTRDEPDGNGIAETECNSQNQIYWNNSSIPTMINLNVSNKFNRYGFIADIACMDHYVYYAPNIITNTGSLRTAQPGEAQDYMMALKKNLEPKTVWCYSQMAMAGWSNQPRSWMVTQQAWDQIAVGAKSVLWFKYSTGWESNTSYQNAVDAGAKVAKQIEQIKNILPYTDVSDNLQRSTTNFKGRQLVGENQTIVVLVNRKITVSGFSFAPSYSTSQVTGTMTVPVPSHIPIQQVTEIDINGNRLTPAYTVSGQNVTFNIDMYDGSGTRTPMARVYVIGRPF